ncbi:class I SAM-dependent methyltransferase [Paenibacillus glacialis]|uniref:Methyltransferase type 11 domain-containing protein n=1 Tax=Paenibacillus glacialis TaxID=494026 RepID=A0A162LSV3_9BACL|nr:class I SAM-dependent methyltransferase [Paenibacillus glacialis]OAB33783.1 hypothetical protein PGLA_22900 [Paenibacillus glacialis]
MQNIEYWEKQKDQGKQWQDERYRSHGMVWGREAGPTVPYAVKIFSRLHVKKVLVIGCGYGRECFYFKDQGFDVTGIDFSLEGIKLANEWLSESEGGTLKFLKGDALQLEFEDNEFDAIFTHKVIHQFNLADRKRMISEMDRVLKPNGVFILSDLSVEDPDCGRGRLIEPDTYIRPEKEFRPIHYLSESSMDIFSQFTVLGTVQFDEWENHPGENTAHKHVFMRVTGLKNADL